MIVTQLQAWQIVVQDFINGHDEFVGGEEFQSLSDYDINKHSCITIALPKGSGHTTMAAVIASTYPTAVIYSDLEHLEEIRRAADICSESCAISVYELYYAIMTRNDPQQPTNNIEKLSQKLKDKKVVVVDQASLLLPGIRDWLLYASKGIVVFLG